MSDEPLFFDEQRWLDGDAPPLLRNLARIDRTIRLLKQGLARAEELMPLCWEEPPVDIEPYRVALARLRKARRQLYDLDFALPHAPLIEALEAIIDAERFAASQAD